MAATTSSTRIARMKHLFNLKREVQDRIQNLENNLSSLQRVLTAAAEEQDTALCAAFADSYRLTHDSLDHERGFLATINAEIKALSAEREGN